MKRGIRPMRIIEEDSKHILRCEGRKKSRDEVSNKRFSNISVEISNRRIVGCKNEE
jgi:hypothetical protein